MLWLILTAIGLVVLALMGVVVCCFMGCSSLTKAGLEDLFTLEDNLNDSDEE